MPGIEQALRGGFVEPLAQIDADDLGAQRRRERPDGEARRGMRRLPGRRQVRSHGIPIVVGGVTRIVGRGELKIQIGRGNAITQRAS
jgi:hypothetical protein